MDAYFKQRSNIIFQKFMQQVLINIANCPLLSW